MNKMSSFYINNVVVLCKKCRRFRQQRSQLHQQAEIVEVNKIRYELRSSFGKAILNSLFSIRSSVLLLYKLLYLRIGEWSYPNLKLS
jgi:hypothetical protein